MFGELEISRCSWMGCIHFWLRVQKKKLSGSYLQEWCYWSILSKVEHAGNELRNGFYKRERRRLDSTNDGLLTNCIAVMHFLKACAYSSQVLLQFVSIVSALVLPASIILVPENPDHGMTQSTDLLWVLLSFQKKKKSTINIYDSELNRGPRNK